MFFRRMLLVLSLLGALTVTVMAQPESAAPEPQPYPPGSISQYHATALYGLLGEPLPQKLEVKVESAKIPTRLGGEQRHPVEDAEVFFQLAPEARERGAELATTHTLTNPGGVAGTRLVLGETPGEYVVEAFTRDAKGEVVGPVFFRVVGGVVVKGNRQDARAGQPAPNPIEVKVEAAPGVPMPGAEVIVDLISPAGKGSVKPERTLTNSEGRASFIVVPGDENGKAEAVLQIRRPTVEPEGGGWIDLGAIHMRFFALDMVALFIQVLGGLAIFIFGMRQLSQGLTLIAGDRLRQWLNFLTKNRLMGLMAGTLVTGLIQSSSTTSVMVIGFVNAGLFQLKQAISVIFGANIGTTVTAQMISFKLDHLALPAVIIGVILMLVGRRERQRHWAMILIGFGLLFLGLGMMGSPLKALKDSQLMQGFFAGLSCTPTAEGFIPLSGVLRCVLVGTFVTVVVQSSSASIGLLLTLVGTGLLDVWTAFPILLGDNIGTTVTAVLASIGTNRASRRVAVSHVMFNVTGVLVMIALLYVPLNGRPIFMEVVNWITNGNAFNGENLERYLANAHTLFNVTAALVFLPFISVFSWVSYRVIGRHPDEAEEERITYLEPHLLGTPSVAIAQVYKELAYMNRQGQRALRISRDVLIAGDDTGFEKQYERIQRREARMDRLQEEILAYIQRISSRQMTEAESRYIPRLIHAVNDSERIGDICIDILKLLRRIHKRRLNLSPAALEEMEHLFDTVIEMYDRVLQALEEGNPKLFDRVAALRKRVNMVRKNMRQSHIQRLEADPDAIRSGVVYIEMIGYLAGIADLLNELKSAYEDAFAGPGAGLTPDYDHPDQLLDEDANGDDESESDEEPEKDAALSDRST